VAIKAKIASCASVKDDFRSYDTKKLADTKKNNANNEKCAQLELTNLSFVFNPPIFPQLLHYMLGSTTK